MTFPKGIERRQKAKDEIGKLEKELRLFYVLYTDWLHPNHEASEGGPGATTDELRRLIAPSAQESALRRMLDRYLLELRQCGAVCKTRVSRNGHCVAQFDESVPPPDWFLGDAHLNRLARTTALMRRFLDKDQPAGYGLWSFDDVRFYSKVFFASNEEMTEWYERHFHMDDTQRRTMQRDMGTTWKVIYELRTEGHRATPN